MDAARQVAPQRLHRQFGKLARVAHAQACLPDRQSLSSTETARPMLYGPWPAYDMSAALGLCNERAYGTGSLSLVQRLHGPML